MTDPVHFLEPRIELLPVDERVVNPEGFLPNPRSGPSRMEYDGSSWVVYGGGLSPYAMPSDGTVTGIDIEAVRDCRSVAVDWSSHPGDAAGLQTVAALAAAGIPLTVPTSVPLWAAPLGSDMVRELRRYSSSDLSDSSRREHHSVRTRRLALTAHSRAASRLAQTTVSAVLCTRRPEFIASALRMIEGQRHHAVETILVLHGIEAASADVKAALEATSMPVTVVEVDPGAVFGEALNRGVAAASGEYVTKIDDDDWYGPDHIGDMLLAAAYSGKDLVGCFAEYVYLAQLGITIYRPGGRGERSSTLISGGTLTTRREVFLSLGGFPAVPTAVDIGLLERYREAGAEVYRTHGLGYVLARRASGHTWDAAVNTFLRSSERQWTRTNLGELVVSDGLGDFFDRQ